MSITVALHRLEQSASINQSVGNLLSTILEPTDRNQEPSILNSIDSHVHFLFSGKF